MCLAVPALVEEVLENETARVRVGGVFQEVSTVLLEDLRPGDYVVVHVGFALSRIDPVEAQKTLRLMETLASSRGER
jgi:hydrogenase expression/formation protein HypC